jgi:amicyanin
MDKKTMTAIIVALVVVLGVVGVVALTGSKSDDGKTDTASSSSTTSGSTSTTNSDNSSADSTPVAATAVKIQNFAFSPATIKVKVGDTVTWTNEDSIGHTVTADNNTADGPKSELLEKGKSYSFKFTKAGTFAYHCSTHPYMKGTVQVTQ